MKHLMVTTVRGQFKAYRAEFSGTAKSPYGHTVAGFTAHGQISRKDFGVNFNAILETGGVAVGDKVKIEIAAEAIARALTCRPCRRRVLADALASRSSDQRIEADREAWQPLAAQGWLASAPSPDLL